VLVLLVSVALDPHGPPNAAPRLGRSSGHGGGGPLQVAWQSPPTVVEWRRGDPPWLTSRTSTNDDPPTPADPHGTASGSSPISDRRQSTRTGCGQHRRHGQVASSPRWPLPTRIDLVAPDRRPTPRGSTIADSASVRVWVHRRQRRPIPVASHRHPSPNPRHFPRSSHRHPPGGDSVAIDDVARGSPP
jgi:hypothetical protein